MANSMKTLELQPNRKPEIALARTPAVFVSLGCLTSSLVLAKVVAIFGWLFKGLAVDLPFATRFLVANYGWISALFAGGAVVLPTVGEFLIPATRRRLIITGSAFAATVASLALVVLVLYLPLIELAGKSGQAK
jgi:type II secretory pathway component PulF